MQAALSTGTLHRGVREGVVAELASAMPHLTLAPQQSHAHPLHRGVREAVAAELASAMPHLTQKVSRKFLQEPRIAIGVAESGILHPFWPSFRRDFWFSKASR